MVELYDTYIYCGSAREMQLKPGQTAAALIAPEAMILRVP
jgi:hypothetical protein